MVLLGYSWCLLVGLCVLVPTTTPQGAPEEDMPPKIGGEELGYQHSQDGDLPLDPQRCDITFHTPSPCRPRGPPPSASPRELDHLKNLLQATKASLKAVEMVATLEDNQSSYQEMIREALPTIHEANLEFQESLENVRRELEAHVAEAEHPRVVEKKEKLQKGVQVVAHMLRLTSHLAQNLEDISHRLHLELSQRLQNASSHPPRPPQP